MHVDIDDYDTGMRLLEIGAVVKVPEAPARPDTSARKLDHDHSADVLPTAEMKAAETTEPSSPTTPSCSIPRAASTNTRGGGT